MGKGEINEAGDGYNKQLLVKRIGGGVGGRGGAREIGVHLWGAGREENAKCSSSNAKSSSEFLRVSEYCIQLTPAVGGSGSVHLP